MDTVKLNIERITDVIGDDYYKKWRSGDVVKIQAQTGSGKTHFIVNTLANQLLEYEFNPKMNEKMLILCNRINLKRQLKKDLCKKFKIDIPDNLKDLDEMTKINNVTVMSYQTLNEMLINEQYDEDFDVFLEYKYIVCDEIHYILEDSFTTKTKYTLDALIKSKSSSIKIFMSATMGSLDVAIDKFFTKNQEECFGTGIKDIHEYKTGIDYSYIDPYYFKKDETIIDRIINDETDEKWIIFITKIQNGKTIMRKLQENGVNVELIHAKSKSKELNNIVMNEKFNCKVLIATTCLNNGININDEKVKHIVCKSYNLTTFVQEIGRIRVNIHDAYKINLYLPTSTKKQWLDIRKIYDKIIDDCTLLKTNPNEFKRKYNDNPKDLPDGVFSLSPEMEWKINITRQIYAYEQQKFINGILDNFDKHKEKTYIMKQLNELGLNKYISKEKSLEVIYEDKRKNEIKDYVISIMNTYLNDEDKNKLIDIINLRDDRNRKQRGFNSIKGYLEDNFRLTLDNDNREYVEGSRQRRWVITRIE